jgi:Flp pilus assembly protein TadD
MLDRKGDSTGAATIAGDLVAAGSRDAHIHARLGHFRDRTGDPAGAEAAYRKAVELAPDVSPYRIALSGLAERAGRLTEAIAVIEPLNGAGSLDPHLHARLGQLLSQTGDLAGSEAALRQAAELAPDEPGFGRALANLLDRQNRSHEALVIVEQLVATVARDRDTLGWLGHLRARTGNLDGAEITLREALGVASADPALQLALADTLDRKGRTDEALTVVKGVVTAGTRDRHTYGRLGKLLVRAGDFDGAETAYRQAIELAPEETGLRFALADTLDRKGRTEEAISIVREMVAAGMRDRQTYRRLGNLLSRVGELTAANAAFRQADGMGS